jgi:glycosyltransferase involved in cell wall biosynthesis
MTSAATLKPGEPTVCYLTKRFPRVSETFILDEIIGLEAHGVPLRLFALADPHERVVQPEVDQVASPVRYLHRGMDLSTRLADLARALAGHARLARRHPRRWLGVVGRVLVSRRHRSTFRHLLEAGAMAFEVEQVGGAHLHAAFAHGPASVAHFVSLLTGVPFSFAAHAKDLYLSSPEILALRVAAAEFVPVCSQAAAEDLRRIVAADRDPAVRACAHKIVLAHHGVDICRFRPAAGSNRPGPLSILAVGRLVAKKGYPVLLGALEVLLETGVDFRCLIVGDGALRNEVEERIAAGGLSGRVTLAGTRTQQEIVEEYRRAEIFVQASLVTGDGDRDGIPNAVLEAMASGLAVVASSVAGIAEVVDHGRTGLLVAPGDPAALAGALTRLIEDEALRCRLGASARKYVEAQMSRSACIAAVAGLFPFAAERPSPAQLRATGTKAAMACSA